MANTDITCPAGEWTLLTDSDVTALRVQNTAPTAIFLMGTVGATAPSSTAGAMRLDAGAVLLADVLLADLFPGVSGANRVYAYSEYQGATVSVSHA